MEKWYTTLSRRFSRSVEGLLCDLLKDKAYLAFVIYLNSLTP